MKQTAIKISINNNRRNYVVQSCANDGKQRMTSLEIANLTGKPHNDVMKAIRKMEPAWAKVAQGNFSLGSYIDANNQMRPCYSLTKTECLYVATKFNDEARAKLVIRWEQLERAKALNDKEQMKNERPKEIRLLACDEEVLDEADDILGEELAKLNRHSKYCFTPKELAKEHGMETADFNSFLKDIGLIRWSRGRWYLTREYRHMDLAADHYDYKHASDGRRFLDSYLVWTATGRQFIRDIVLGKIKLKKKFSNN